MKKKNQAIAILRDRGQVTIPDEIRSSLYWMSHNSALSFSIVDPYRVSIEPQRPGVDWDAIHASIAKARSIHGKSKQSAASFLAKDRQSH